MMMDNNNKKYSDNDIRQIKKKEDLNGNAQFKKIKG